MHKEIKTVQLFRPFDTGVRFGLGLMFAPVVVLILLGGLFSVFILSGLIASPDSFL